MNKLFTRSLAVVAVTSVMAGALVLTAPAKAGADPDPTGICNMSTNILQYDATMPAGTVRANVTPEFEISISNTCVQDFNARFVTVTTPYVVDAAGNYVQSGNSFTEISKPVLLKANTFAVLKNRINRVGVSQVTQMRSDVQLYHSSSFDANGNLLPGATPMASDVAGWTQTNFRTL